MKALKKYTALALCLSLIFGCFSVFAFAEDSNVTYEGDAEKFIFSEGSEYSLTDLFPDFKGVMPGDTRTQKLTFKNNADADAKVKIYLRSLGADEDSDEFLNKLKLTVQEVENTPMFEAAADQTAGLTDWVYLGTLYSGGVVDINITLEVPTTLDNSFQNKVGRLDWQFTAEEFPINDEYSWKCPNGEEHPYHIEVINGVPTYVCDICENENEAMYCDICGKAMHEVVIITIDGKTYTAYPNGDGHYVTKDGRAEFFMDDRNIIEYYIIDGVKTYVKSIDEYSLYTYYECVAKDYHTEPHRPDPHHTVVIDGKRDSDSEKEWFSPLTGGEPAMKICVALLGISAVGIIAFSRDKRQKDKKRVEH